MIMSAWGHGTGNAARHIVCGISVGVVQPSTCRLWTDFGASNAAAPLNPKSRLRGAVINMAREATNLYARPLCTSVDYMWT